MLLCRQVVVICSYLYRHLEVVISAISFLFLQKKSFCRIYNDLQAVILSFGLSFLFEMSVKTYILYIIIIKSGWIMLLQGAFKWGCDCENRYTKATSVKYGECAVSLFILAS